MLPKLLSPEQVILNILKSTVLFGQLLDVDLVALEDVLHHDAKPHVEVLSKGDLLLEAIEDAEVFPFAFEVKSKQD